MTITKHLSIQHKLVLGFIIYLFTFSIKACINHFYNYIYYIVLHGTHITIKEKHTNCKAWFRELVWTRETKRMKFITKTCAIISSIHDGRRGKGERAFAWLCFALLPLLLLRGLWCALILTFNHRHHTIAFVSSTISVLNLTSHPRRNFLPNLLVCTFRSTSSEVSRSGLRLFF